MMRSKRIQSEETRTKISQTLKGRKVSKTTRLKMSLARKGKKRPDLLGNKFRKGFKTTEKTKTLMSHNRLKAYKTGKRKAYWSGKNLSDNHVSKIRVPHSNRRKGGKYTLNSGYIMIYKPSHEFRTKNGYILEHRYVLEVSLGRKLLPNEHVHHIDKNRTNNKMGNLILFSSQREHNKYHANEGHGQYSAR